MPNWCNNLLTLEHDDPKQIDRAVKAFNAGEFFEEFVPIPECLKEDDVDTEAAIKACGYGSWYDFCIARWGTKWDANAVSNAEVINDNTVCLTFDTAWSPPIEVYDVMGNLGFRVYGYYYEPGAAFCGLYNEGSDQCFSIPGDSESIRDEIPAEIDDMFGISESMAEWERENEDEVTSWYKDGVEETGLEPHTLKKPESKND